MKNNDDFASFNCMDVVSHSKASFHMFIPKQEFTSNYIIYKTYLF